MDANIQVVLTCSLQIINKKIAQTDSHYRQEGDTDAIAPVSGRPGTPKLADSANTGSREEEEQNQKRSKERLMESKVVVPAEGQKSPCKTAN